VGRQGGTKPRGRGMAGLLRGARRSESKRNRARRARNRPRDRVEERWALLPGRAVEMRPPPDARRKPQDARRASVQSCL
jgi:hypothetical protein